MSDEEKAGPPVGLVLDVGYAVVFEEKVLGTRSMVGGHHYYSKELAASTAYDWFDYVAHEASSPEGQAEIMQLVETGVLEGDNWRLRLVPVSLVVREEGSNGATEAH